MKLLIMAIWLSASFATWANAGAITGIVKAEGKPEAEQAAAGGKYDSRKYKFVERVDYARLRNFVVHVEGPITNVIAATDVATNSLARVDTKRVKQEKANFSPGVLPIVVGTTVEWPNNDDIFHNVFSMSDAKQFDLELYKGNPPDKRVTFDRVGRVEVFCSIHANMHCTVLVLENPYFAVADENGRYAITNVPAGTYKLKAWHERMPGQSQVITVPVEGDVTANFTLGIKNLPEILIMGKLKRAILLNFRTKVIVPIVGVMVLLMATTMWLINQRVTRQVQADAAGQLTTADAVLNHIQQMRLDSLLAAYRKVEGEGLFKAHAALFAPDQEGVSETAQNTIRDFLNTLMREKFAKVIMVAPLDGPRLTAASDAWVKIEEFESSCASLAATAITNGSTVGVVRNGEQLLDVVAVPIRIGEDVVATFVFGVEDTVADDVRKLDLGEVLLLADGQAVVSTARERELENLLPDQISRAATFGRGQIEKLLLNGEHILCLGGTLKSSRPTSRLSYVILSSYEKPLQVLRETQQLIVLVSLAAIIVGITIVWLYVRRVTEPLEDLREHTEAIGKGDFTRRVELDSRDEFGDLAEAFNHMTENLKFSREQLEKTVDSLKATQAQLIQSEKLSGIGEFVAGVAHELNNPLTTVMGFSELLQLTDSNPQQKRHLQMIHQSAVRCRKIVQNLLSFSRRHQPERKLTCLNTLVGSAIDILGYQLRTSNIEVTTKLEPNLPNALVDSHQLEQVFINILNNGRQAIEAHQPKGTIRISTSRHGDRLKVVFQDDGPGIPADNIAKLFDPFFTTKEIGKGTGLGLSICYGIVKEHGGNITVQSEYGHGASFAIELPAAVTTDQAAFNTARFAKPSAKCRSGTGKSVLVIDDEEPILEMVSEILTSSGYRVAVATDGESALQKLKQENFDLAICDWKMPGLNGRQFYERICTTHPALARNLIFMSGDVINSQIQGFLTQHQKFCLSKPFSLDDFETAINGLVPVS